MSRRTPKLFQTCRIVTTTRNRYGDIEYGATTQIDCLYREITSLQTGNANKEQVTVDGIFWFAPNAAISRGTVVLFEGEYYRMDKVNKARARLTDNAVAFLKCEAMRQRQVS